MRKVYFTVFVLFLSVFSSSMLADAQAAGGTPGILGGLGSLIPGGISGLLPGGLGGLGGLIPGAGGSKSAPQSADGSNSLSNQANPPKSK